MRVEPRCRIVQLDEATISRIAAGEVVERPASVVKELCENALDSGASAIDIRISSRDGEITGITVTDDGCGMNPGEAHLAFSRHATSKIREIGDLPACATLGFRGEALASIAAVSRVTLTTREKGTAAVSGVRLVSEGGTIAGMQEAGCPAGTCVSVEDLFFNTPARRKFQRSLTAELSRITGTVERLVITHPSIAFRLTVDGREKLSVPGGGGGLYDAIIHLFGLDLAGGLVEVSADGEHLGIRGYLSVPDLSRKSPYQIYLSVNARPVSSRLLVAAVRKAYGSLLPGDRYPVAFLDFKIPGADVDVNVHPAKREVRFSCERDILAEVTALLKEALSSRALLPGKDTRAAARVVTGDTQPGIRYQPDSGVTGVREPLLRERLLTGRQLRLTEAASPGGTPREDGTGCIPDLRVIGQIGNLYILCSTPDDDLLLIDQHAAHERILYEQIGTWSSFHDRAQELIEPVIIRLSPREADLFPLAVPILKEEGFDAEPFGPQAWAIRTVPVTLGRTADPGMVREIIAELIAPGSPREVDAAERLRRIVACRGAVKAGAACTPEQCDQMIRQLRTTENPFTCPHGRPTMVVFTKKKLDEIFRRI